MPEETLTIWKLYDNTELTREKNREVEDLENWLEGNFVYRQHSHGQYFKHALNKTLKINADQRILDFFTETNNIDYASVKNPDDSQPVYYFVTAKRWIAEKTIELTLLMDTINTFKNNYTLSEKTTINREHENRFFVNSGGYMRRLVDKVDEGIQPQLYKTEETNVWNGLPPLIELPPESGHYVYDYSVKDTTKFYLFYANKYATPPQDGYNPLNGFLCLNNYQRFFVEWNKHYDYSGAGQNSAWILDPTPLADLVAGRIITTALGARYGIRFITQSAPIVPAGMEIRIFGILITPVSGGNEYEIPSFFDGTYYWTSAIYYDGGWKAQEMRISIDGTVSKGAIYEISNGDFRVFSRTNRYEERWIYRVTSKNNYLSLTDFDDLTDIRTETLDTAVRTEIATLNALDRTNAKLQKLIELPYAPAHFEEITYSGEKLLSLIDTGFTVGEFEGAKFLQLLELNGGFKNTLHNEDPILFMKEDFDKTPTANDTANAKNESKLFNSAFWLSKFVYDSFSYNFNYEQADDWSNVSIDFIPTTTMNSKWAFIFNWNKKNEKEDFGKVLLVSRNNELPIYSNGYLDYIRTSYNYDVKLRESQLQLQLANGAMSLGFGAASLAAGIDMGDDDQGAPIAGGIGLMAHGVTTVMSAISNNILSERAQAQKMEQLKNQKTSVIGGDDIDLLNAYCGNKAQILTYKVSSEMRNMLYELFRFYGYKTNKRGNPRDFVTNGNKRYWYNYIQCEPVFNRTENISEECLKDIENRYKEGITIFHKHNGDYDFDQDKENWEEFLIGHQEPQDDPLDDMFEDVGTVGAGSGQWSLGHPIYGNSSGFDVGMASGQLFEFIVNDDASDPQYWFEAKDGFNNVYRFIPGVKVVMTRQLDGRQFEKPLTVGHLYRLTSGLRTSNVPLLTSVAAGFLYSETATKNE